MSERYEHEARVMSEKLQQSEVNTQQLMEMVKDKESTTNGSVFGNEKETFLRVKSKQIYTSHKSNSSKGK